MPEHHPSTLAPARLFWIRNFPIYYGWVCVVVAAAAMTATLPGRTHGLGLITEPLIADLSLERTDFARINLTCTLLGAAVCLPVGGLIDRYGVRRMLTLVIAGLGLSVLAMSRSQSAQFFAASLLFARGFGQGALSVISLSIVGKWFERRLGPAMGLFAVLLTFGFIGSILGMGAAVQQVGWRSAWWGLGVTLLAFTPICWLLARDTPEAAGLPLDGVAPAAPQNSASDTAASPSIEFTWQEALATPTFWVFAAGTALFNLAWSAITLFNESILAEQGFDSSVAVQMLAVLTGSGLVANIVAGRLATRERLGRLLGAALAILATALAAFPNITTKGQLWGYGLAMGVTGGLITVVFFAAWTQLFGRGNLGRIQGTAQFVSILASAAGPWIFAESQAVSGTYHTVFYNLAAVTALAAAIACSIPLPRQSSTIIDR